MEYKEFFAAFKKELDERLGGDGSTEVVRVDKNNGNGKEGLMIKGGDSPALPVIYPEEFYRFHKEMGEDVVSIAEKAAYICMREREKKEVLDEFCRDILSWETAKEYLMPELIRAEWNREILKEAASIPFLDLAVCFRLQKERPGGGIFSFRLSKKQTASWGLSERELMEQGRKNLRCVDHKITGLTELMEGIFGAGFFEDEETDFAVLTTPERTYGTSGILRKELLADYADRLGKNLFLIPSSVHEFILMPDDGKTDLEKLECLINRVNSEQVAREEQLSDHAYYYDREKGEIRLRP